MATPTASLLPHLLAERARNTPDRTYLEQVGGGTLTYAETHTAALRWAAALEQAGAGPGSVVATMVPAGLVGCTLMIGLTWSEAIETPVNLAYRGDMLAHQLADSGAETIVIAQRYLPALATVPGAAERLRVIVVADAEHPEPAPDDALWAHELLAAAEPAERPGPTPDDLAWVLYTSGTTGRSKGVMCGWTQTYLNAVGLPLPWDELTEEDCFYCASPMFHVLARMYPYAAALIGGRCVIRESFKTDEFWGDIARHGCTATMMLASMATFFLDRPARPDDADTPLRICLLNPLLPGRTDELMERFGVTVRTGYNMTELSLPIVSPPTLVDDRSCGIATENYELRIADEQGDEVPHGTVGELLVRPRVPGAIMSGYWGQPEKTVEAWRDLWFHTGDAFRRDEAGNHYFMDRLKDAVRRRGENISSLEVERVVLTHPAVAEVAVIGVPAADGENEVMAFVVPEAGRELDPDALSVFLLDALPRFMVPRYLETVDALPRTPATLRVQKAALRERGVGPGTWDRVAAVAR